MTLRMPALCSNAGGKRRALALNGSGATKGGVPDTIFSGNSSTGSFFGLLEVISRTSSV